MKSYISILIFIFIASFCQAAELKTTEIDGREYIALEDICKGYGFNYQHKFYPGRIVLKGPGETVVLLPQGQRALINNRLFSLEAPVKILDGVIFVPSSFAVKAFSGRLLRESAKAGVKNEVKEQKQKQEQEQEQEQEEQFIPKINLIIVDAGHGGHDPGAIGPNGLMEKEINLDIARKLAGLITMRLPVRVLMTRDEDTFVTLANRATFANSKGAGLFISIHCNAAFSPKMQGCETFFVSEAVDPEARAVEVLENSVVNLEIRELGVSKDKYLRSILEDMIYHEFVRESSMVAFSIQANMVKKLKLTDRGVKTALFYVLRGVAAPSVLVEVAFLSYAPEEAKLATESFRKMAAEAIYNGVREYLKNSSK